MAITKPNLDDRVFHDLMEEVKTLIPRYNEKWTNFNATDPGITILELLAWLSDQVLFRLNRIPEKSYINFLKMVGIDLEPDESFESGVRRARTLLEEVYRAITEEDYVYLIAKKMEEIQTGLSGRVIVLQNADLSYIPDSAGTLEDLSKMGHISIIVIPRCDGEAGTYCDPDFLPGMVPGAQLMDDIYWFLASRRLLSTTVHIVSPKYVTIDIIAWVSLEENADAQIAMEDARKRITDYYHPIDGGPEGKGWPSSRAFYKSELFQLLDGARGIDFVEKTAIKVNGVVIDSNWHLKPWEFITVGDVKIEIMG